MNTNYYLVKIVFKVAYLAHPHTHNFQEQWRLIKAVHEEHAQYKAMLLGRLESTTHIGKVQDLIQWQCKYAEVLTALSDDADGCELYSVWHTNYNNEVLNEQIKY